MHPPEIEYVRARHGDIACRVMGEGTSSLVFINPMSRSIETLWDYPPNAALLERLAHGRRLVTFDRRGCGISDHLPVGAPPTWEAWLEDLLAVLDHLDIPEAALLAERDAAAAAVLFAGSHPERVQALVLGNTSARFRVAPDYPCGESEERSELLSQMWETSWGTERMVSRTRERLTGDPEYMRWVTRMQRISYSPRRAGAEFRYIINFDARAVLGSIRAPTLILHRREFAVIPPAHAEYLVAHIPGSRLELLPGGDMDVLLPGDDSTLELIEGFLADLHPANTGTEDRALTTVLCVDLPLARQAAVNVGSARWGELLERCQAIVRGILPEFHGRGASAGENGFAASFDGPARAVRCALAIRQRLRDELRLEIRAGLHTGECERVGDALSGEAAEVAPGVMQAAEPGEVLVTAAVKDLMVGAGVEFRELGAQPLPGVPGNRALFVAEG